MLRIDRDAGVASTGGVVRCAEWGGGFDDAAYEG
jgi:hypothetical protein